jgi:hypothetical protein
VDPIALLAPFPDAVTVFEAAGYGASAEAVQASGLETAASTFRSLLRRRVRGKDGWTVGRYGVLLAVILLAFFFRSGLLGLSIGTCGGRSQVAIGFAVIETAPVMRFGVV